MPLLPGGGWPALLAASARAPAEVAERARRILEGGDYQRALPDLQSFSLGSLGPLAGLVRALLWAALAVAVALAALWLWRRLSGRARDALVEPDPAAAPLLVPLGDAERLARAGRYGEAIHALLLETLAALSRAARLAPSFTSREIVARVPLPPRAREALAGLVEAVEISRFGGAQAGEGEYRACLARFHAFLETYRRRQAGAEEAAA
jgi:hypothetical protein